VGPQHVVQVITDNVANYVVAGRMFMQRYLLNFLVNCPKGSMFVKSVDASAHVKDASLLCDLLD
jgi:hypothetical protein